MRQREVSKSRSRKKLRKAYEYLMTNRNEYPSSYKAFVKKHKKFLGPDPSDVDCRRPLQFLETPGLECALWPSLYWCTEMCETVERATDGRRLEKYGQRAVMNDDEDGELPEERHSVKKSFMRKVLSPVMGYSQDFELLQFVYDLCMWSRIGGGKNACKGLPLRLVLKGETFSPLYWKEKHQGLVDMQRQCGYPRLFKTMAPWEYSFPYHVFVLDEMAACGRGRMQSACFETLHTAHVFTEINRGLFSGKNNKGWKNHLLGAVDGETPTVVNFFQRLEFQDGKRKLPTQDYHGSGRVHVHSLDYLENVEHVGLEQKMSATVPDTDRPLLRGAMLGRPHGRGDSGWQVDDGPSRFDPETDTVKLHHTAEDKATFNLTCFLFFVLFAVGAKVCCRISVVFACCLQANGHRAYFPEVLEVLKCHQDVLHGSATWQGLLLKYVATYAPKFSDSFAREWLNDEASAFSVARRVLFDYQPGEPEMWLYIFAQLIPPCRSGGTLFPLICPYPGMEEPYASTKRVLEAYEACTWRGDAMCLLDFCRKTNDKGEIHRWVKDLHKSTGGEDGTLTLQEFAKVCPMKGQKLVACDMLSVFNDRWFGQWLALREPFRSLDDLLDVDLVEKAGPALHADHAQTTAVCV